MLRQELKSVTSSVFNLANSAIPKVGNLIDKSIVAIQDKAEEAFGINTRQKKSDPLKIPAWLRLLFNNPIINAVLKFNPLSWAMDVFAEEADSLGIEIKIPAFPSVALDKFSSILANWFEKAGGQLLSMLTDLANNLASIVGNFSPDAITGALKDMFGRIVGFIIDSVGELLHSILELLSAILEATEQAVSGTWKIPILTKMWEVFADQEFSILNFATFFIAHVMNIAFAPFGGEDKIVELLRRLKDEFHKHASQSKEEFDEKVEGWLEKQRPNSTLNAQAAMMDMKSASPYTSLRVQVAELGPSTSTGPNPDSTPMIETTTSEKNRGPSANSNEAETKHAATLFAAPASFASFRLLQDSNDSGTSVPSQSVGFPLSAPLLLVLT